MIVEQLIAIGAAILSIGLSGVASGYQMKKLGIISEKVFESKEEERTESRKFFTHSLVFTVFDETPAIYGLLLSILILLNINASLTIFSSYSILLSALVIGVPAVSAAFGIGIIIA